MLSRSAVVCAGALLALAISLSASAALAAWPHHPSINLPLTSTPYDQFNQDIIADGNGGAIATWEDTRSGTSHIYAQHVTAKGEVDPLWPPDGVAVCTESGGQLKPKLVSDGAGGAIIVWQDFRTGFGDLYAQRVTSDGNAVWTVNGVVVCDTLGHENDPRIVSDGAGGAIICWRDSRDSNYDVYAQRITASGDEAWTHNGVGLCTDSAAQYDPRIIADGFGGAIVTWYDYRGAASDIYAQRISADGLNLWNTDGAAICTVSGGQSDPELATDHAGGAIITWTDARSGTPDIYAQHIKADGLIQWTTLGAAVSTDPNTQTTPKIISDVDGAVILWSDYRNGSWDQYAQRLSMTGNPEWTGNGEAVAIGTGIQNVSQLMTDGEGGAIVVWEDITAAVLDIYAQHIDSEGALVWTSGGVVVCNAVSAQNAPVPVTDGKDGVIIAWLDARGDNHPVYAQRLDRYGYMGTTEPEIVSVSDVPNDEGGEVKLSWYASYLDRDNDPDFDHYEIYRSVPTSQMEAGLARGARLLESPADAAEPGRQTFLTTVLGTSVYAWEFLATQDAKHYLPAYAYLSPTTGDSTGAYNPLTAFMVVGRNISGSKYWLSLPDSGYSVDNLAPIAPAPFTGQYAAGTTTLHWGVSSETDFNEYRLYHGTVPDFTPGPGNLVVSKPDTGYVHSAMQPYYYKLSAVDVHGNESPFALLLPSGTVDVPGPAPSALWLAPVTPNPARGEASIRFSLPYEVPVTLAVYDAGGRRVLALHNGTLEAGEHTIQWDGRRRGGQLTSSGLYFVQLEAGENKLTRRFVTIR